MPYPAEKEGLRIKMLSWQLGLLRKHFMHSAKFCYWNISPYQYRLSD